MATIEYIQSVSDGVVRYYRSDEGYEGFETMSLPVWDLYLTQQRAALDRLEADVKSFDHEVVPESGFGDDVMDICTVCGRSCTGDGKRHGDDFD